MTLTTRGRRNTGDLLDTIAAQLADPAIIDRTSGERTNPASLAGGAAGIALLHLERAVSEHGDDATAHRWIRAATLAPVSAGPNANLFHGVPTLALLLHTATTTLGGYQRTATLLAERTIALTQTRLTAATARLDAGQPLTMREFDLVHGLTGYGVYHLRRHPDHPITRDVLTYLTRLTAPLPHRPERPPWWLDSGLAGTPDSRFPHGHGNLGIAHGISAVIALLALAVNTGHHPPGTLDALAHLCSWTDQHRNHSGTSWWWPPYITDTSGPAPSRHRPSWCYGTAGTARAQQLAGLALHDTVRQHHAEAAMLTAVREPGWRTLLPEPCLCHGKAGLLQAAWRTATSSTSTTAAQITAHLPDLADDLAHQLETAPPDTPELMNGLAGAALALHTAHTGTSATGWDAVLLLA